MSNLDELIYRNIAFDKASFQTLQHVKREYDHQHGVKLSNSLVIKLILSEYASKAGQCAGCQHGDA